MSSENEELAEKRREENGWGQGLTGPYPTNGDCADGEDDVAHVVVVSESIGDIRR